MAFLELTELKKIGLKKIGENVKISDKAVFYNPSQIEIDDFSRIDDFAVISAGTGGIKIGKNVHIAVFCSLMGMGKIELQDFSGLSSRVSIYSSSDDYSGNFLTNPTVSSEYTNVISGDVILKKHVIVGVGSCILPNVIIDEGSAIGAFSLVMKNVERNVIAAGVPAKKVKKRSEKIFELEKKFIKK